MASVYKAALEQALLLAEGRWHSYVVRFVNPGSTVRKVVITDEFVSEELADLRTSADEAEALCREFDICADIRPLAHQIRTACDIAERVWRQGHGKRIGPAVRSELFSDLSSDRERKSTSAASRRHSAST